MVSKHRVGQTLFRSSKVTLPDEAVNTSSEVFKRAAHSPAAASSCQQMQSEILTVA